MMELGETYKHSNVPLEKIGRETLSTVTFEPLYVEQMWKVTRGEIYIVPGRTETQAYQEAARQAGSSVADFFSVTVVAEKVAANLQSVGSDVGGELASSSTDEPVLEFEIPYYGD